MGETLTPRQQRLLARMSAPAGQRTGLFPATAGQRSLWFVDQLTPGLSTYNMPAALRLRGHIELRRLADAVQRLVHRHESLRTTLVAADGRPMQRIRATVTVPLVVVDRVTEREALTQLGLAAHTPFDLATGPLLRAVVWRIAAEDHLLLLVAHHAVADGQSVRVLLAELAAVLAGGPDAPVDPRALNPVDLALREPADWDERLRYWTSQVAGASPPRLPERDCPDPDGPSSGAVRVPLRPSLAGDLARFARQRGTTAYAVQLGALTAVLYGFTRQTDLLIGVPFANRDDPRTERTVGMLVNTMPVRMGWSGTPTIGQLVDQAGSAVRDGMAHGEVPFAALVARAGVERASGQTPFLDVVLTSESGLPPVRQLGGLTVEAVAIAARNAKFGMTFAVEPDAVVVDYDAGRYHAGLVEAVAQALRLALETAVEHPDTRIDRVRLGDVVPPPGSTEEPVGRLGIDSLGVRPDEPGSNCVGVHSTSLSGLSRTSLGMDSLGRVVAAHATAAPGRTALVAEDRTITYGALLIAADQLAARLRTLGCGQQAPVAVFLPRSIEQVIACLAVVRAGGFYLPVDPDHPAARVAATFDDAQPTVVVTTSALAGRLDGHRDALTVIAVDELDRPAQPFTPPASGPDDLAMLVYTSGSTGTPKGIAITHRGIVHLVADNQHLPPRSDRTFLHLSSTTFDASTWEIWSTLLAGGRGAILGAHEYTPEGIGRAIRAHDVTTALLTTQLFHTVVDEDVAALTPLRELLVGGEAVSADHVRRAQRALPRTRLFNAYGPAEITVIATMHPLTDPLPAAATQVPIGGALNGTTAYLLDGALQPVPVGAVGELALGGDGVARGYRGRPGLTGERFVPSPFVAGGRLYRTGDLARQRPDGAFEFLGRGDRQVKIRGHRIEPAEIEARLVAHPQVAEAVVVPLGGALVGYVLPASAAAPEAGEVRTWLRAQLPEFLVPAAIVVLDRFPLTPNGKIDRAALPEPRIDGTAVPTAPATAIERVVADVWREVLARDDAPLSTDEDFFTVGGHSLLATRVVARLSKALGRPVPLGLMFRHPTITGLARALEDSPVGVVHHLRRRPDDSSAPLSLDQERIWLRQQLEPGSSIFHLPLAVRIDGWLDIAALRFALRTAVSRHEPLRSVVELIGDEPRITVRADADPELSIVDLSGLGPDQRATRTDLVLAQASGRPFDLATERPLRAALLRLGDREHVLLVTIHHIAFDGASVALLAREVGECYAAWSAGRPPELPELQLRYGDVAVWQRERLAAGHYTPSLDYWADALRGAPLSLELPTDRSRPAVARNRCQSLPVRLGGPLSSAVQRLAAAHELTPFQTLLAGYLLLLRRHTGQHDVVIGVPVSGRRDHPDLEGIVGCLVDMVPLRFTQAASTVDELLRQVREVCASAFSHADAPFERLVERVLPSRDLSRTPIFQTVLAVPFLPPAQDLPGLTIQSHRLPSPGAQYELALFLGDVDGELAGVVEFDPDLFDRETIELLIEDFAGVLTELSAGRTPTDPARPAIAVGPVREIAHPTVLSAVRAGTGRSGERLVVRGPGGDLSVSRLWARAGAVAAELRAAGVRRGDVVAVCQRRGSALVPSVLGIWLAGGTYLPIDPAFPAARLELMLADSGCRVVLADAAGAHGLPVGGHHTVRVDQLPDGDPDGADAPLGPDDAACLLYTSGSTGRPKGVLIRHRSLVNVLASIAIDVGLRADDTLLAVTTISFDLSLLELFGPLTVGATVVIAGTDEAADPASIARLADASGATVLQGTPSRWRMLLEWGWKPRPELRMWTGGEALAPDLAARLIADGELWNIYAPTETTVYSIGEQVLDPDDVTIGRPLANTEVYVLDRELRPVPVGVAGEIYVGGAGVATGYHARPGLTADRFRPSPWRRGERMYRTGDLGRSRRDGRIVYLGRADQQVKVRGFRIEPGEVESALRACPGVTEAVVTVRDDALVGYVVGGPAGDALRESLRLVLPAHLVPQVLVHLEAIPRTPNGKVDRNALPDPELAELAPEAPPRTALAASIVAAWADALGIEGLSAVQDVFTAGAHSLLATRVAARLSRELRRDVPMRMLFAHPTAEGLAVALERAAIEDRPRPQRTDGADSGRLSFAQQRLWISHQFDPAAPTYNLPLAVRLTGALDVAAVQTALTTLVARHETLRTVIAVEDGIPRAVVRPPAPVGLTVLAAVDRQLPHVLRHFAYEPFDLASTAPVRCALLRLGPADHVLVAVLHHIACDGWSSGILAAEFAEVYAAQRTGRSAELDAVDLRYRDFAVWQRGWLDEERLAAELDHWSAALDRAPRALELPTDHARPPVLGQRGGTRPWGLGPELTGAVRHLAAEHHATEFMVLLAAFATLLSGYSGEREVLIGTPVTGRDHPALDRLVGFFSNTLVVRVDLVGDPTVAELLDRVRARCLDAYEHAELPFERLVERLQPERDPSRTPLFQAMLALQQGPPPTLSLPDLTAEPVDVDNPTAKYELLISLTDDGEQTQGFVEYNRDLYEPTTIDRMGAALVEVLRAMVADPAARVSALPMLPAAEHDRIVADWNQTPCTYDPEICLHELVRRQSVRTPEAIALIDDTTGEQVTYAELERRSNRVARALRDRGVRTEFLVGVVVARSIDLVVALYGVLKAGAAFLPLDPEHPAERLRAILADAGVRVTVSTTAVAETVGIDAPLLVDSPTLRAVSDEPLPRHGSPGGLAYAIYTSGSTGQPKGALIEHRAISNNLLWMQQDWPLDQHDRLLQKTTAAFDVAVKEVFWPLLAGAAVVLARPGGQRDPQYLAELIDRHRITVAHFVPSMLEAALSYAAQGRVPGLGASLEKVMSGAETLPAATLRRFHEQTRAELLHMYGPTETAIAVTGWTCPRTDPPDRVPLGRPMPRAELYVLDQRGRPVPQGVWGELYVGGTAVGRGYLGRPAETAAAFIPDPFSGRPGARLYRTGDLVRLNNDDLLEFGGRRDRQVKVHGFRVELGEVEAALGRHPAVRQAAVLPRRGLADADGLVGYVGVGDGEPPAVRELLAYLRGQVPEYMVPQQLVVLPSLPLGSNGKVDRSRLPDVAAPPRAIRTAPRTDLERAVADVVATVLGVPEVGLDDDLFSLGGHSLQVPQIAALLATRLGVEVRLREIFLDPTVAGVVSAVAAARAEPAQPSQPAPIRVNRADRRRTTRPSTVDNDPVSQGGTHV